MVEDLRRLDSALCDATAAAYVHYENHAQSAHVAAALFGLLVYYSVALWLCCSVALLLAL
jgi:hypothetical protein